MSGENTILPLMTNLRYIVIVTIFVIAITTYPFSIAEITVDPVLEQAPVELDISPSIELLPPLIPICACESAGRPDAIPQHYDTEGNVLRGIINPRDIGMCQISQTYWGEVAIELEYDIFTEEGNILMANYIFEKHGSDPWKWSRHCWNKE